MTFSWVFFKLDGIEVLSRLSGICLRGGTPLLNKFGQAFQMKNIGNQIVIKNGVPGAIRTCDPRLRRAPRRKGVKRCTPAKNVKLTYIEAFKETRQHADLQRLTPMVTVTPQKMLKIVVENRG